jgi:hypothetical protein
VSQARVRVGDIPSVLAIVGSRICITIPTDDMVMSFTCLITLCLYAALSTAGGCFADTDKSWRRPWIPLILHPNRTPCEPFLRLSFRSLTCSNVNATSRLDGALLHHVNFAPGAPHQADQAVRYRGDTVLILCHDWPMLPPDVRESTPQPQRDITHSTASDASPLTAVALARVNLTRADQVLSDRLRIRRLRSG